MPTPNRYSPVRYLTAKATVDDDALNDVVLAPLVNHVVERGIPFLRVIELGAGVGSTFRRLRESGVLSRGEYVMVDLDAASLAEASRVVDEIIDPTDRAKLSVSFVVGDAISYLAREAGEGRRADVVIAQALVDLLNVHEFVTKVTNGLNFGGFLYLPITFDGITIFGPPIDTSLDRQIIAAYHATMDARRTPDGLPTGGSRAGQSLLRALPEAGLELVEEGPSDWHVVPQDGAYPQDVAYFLHHIINFVWESLRDGTAIPVDALGEWIAVRHAQIERGELVYIARQIDVLARKPE